MADVERKRANARAWYAANKERSKTATRRARLWRFFRITPDEFDAIEKFMASHPAYRRLLSRTTTRNAVEHRHRDGVIRGVMAPLLNRAYGLIERLYPTETAEVLRALADFHEKHPATEVLGSTRFGIIGKAKEKKVMVWGGPVLDDRR